MKAGYIYVLSNPAMPGIIKVGCTTDISRRLFELNNSTSIPLPFEVACCLSSQDMMDDEGAVHAQLVIFRISRSREFFRCAPEVAAEIVKIETGYAGRERLKLRDDFRRRHWPAGGLNAMFADDRRVAEWRSFRTPRPIFDATNAGRA